MSDPGVCPHCKGPMKPLFTGFFCPKDCDRPHSQITKLNKAIAEAQDIVAVPRAWSGWGSPIWPVSVPAAYTPRPDQCRDAMCRGTGHKTHSVGQGTPMTWYDNYRCALCSQEWMIPSPPSGGIP